MNPIQTKLTWSDLTGTLQAGITLRNGVLDELCTAGQQGLFCIKASGFTLGNITIKSHIFRAGRTMDGVRTEWDCAQVLELYVDQGGEIQVVSCDLGGSSKGEVHVRVMGGSATVKDSKVYSLNVSSCQEVGDTLVAVHNSTLQTLWVFTEAHATVVDSVIDDHVSE
jgi:hypothetical protein